MTMTLVQDARTAGFADAFGERRGSKDRASADGNWRAALAHMLNQTATGQRDIALLCDALMLDLHQGFQHAAVHALQHFGVAGVKARRIVTRNNMTHLTAEPVHNGTHHPHSMCGKLLAGTVGSSGGPDGRMARATRGIWARPVSESHMFATSEAKLCKKCMRHAHLVPEAAELRDALAFHPEEHAAFDSDLRHAVSALAAQALAGELTADELTQAADAAYLALMLDHAVAAAQANPSDARRGAFSDLLHLSSLKAELDWPGEVDELLDEVDWRALFAASMPEHRRDGRHVTIHAWQEHRSRLQAQLAAIAQRRAAQRRVELCAAEVARLRAQLAAAEDLLADARSSLDDNGR